MSSERRPSRLRRWLVATAILCWLFAGIIYAWGFLAANSTLDVRETCLYQQSAEGLRGPGGYDSEYMLEHEQLLPLSRPCNDHYDLVPGYVNPLFFTSIAAGAGLLTAYFVLRIRTRS